MNARRTRIKFCGITRLEDAEMAASLDAWAIGFILWPGSKRAADPAVASTPTAPGTAPFTDLVEVVGRRAGGAYHAGEAASGGAPNGAPAQQGEAKAGSGDAAGTTTAISRR